MARMLVIYEAPKDKDAFLKHYFDVHIPLAKTLPGIRKYVVSQNSIISAMGDTEVFLIGELHFDSLDAIKAAFASEEGRACAADRKIFAPDDDKIKMYLFDTLDA
jgi:uncharacterized protein (TIGR02118 family)